MKNNFVDSKKKQQIIPEKGYVLPLVIITGMILVVGAAILSAQSFNGLIRSSRQKQAEEAVEIAETGASLLINELNNRFPYLLTVNCQVVNNSTSEQMEAPLCVGWQNFELGQYGSADSACPARSAEPSLVMDLLYKPLATQRGSYRLRNYEFIGDQIQGGKAIIQVQGQRFKGAEGSSDLAASAIVEQEITIAPKCCNKPPFVDLQQCDSGGEKILGLLTKKVTANGGLDVFGDIHTIHSCPPGMTGTPPNCNNSPSQCETYLNMRKDQIKPNDAGRVGELCNHISGESSYGNRDFPIAPTWEEAGKAYNIPGWDNAKAATINQSLVIGHDNDIDEKIKDSCITTTGVDGTKTTHCRIKSINFSGDESINLNPGEDGHISFYLDDGTCNASMNISGSSIINKGLAQQFSIIAGPCLEFPGTIYERSRCDIPWSNKRINISGTSDINGFIYASCADVEVTGTPITFNGSIVSRTITAIANNVQIITPEGDYGSDICKRFDLDICTDSESNSEFAALGSNRWSLIQMEQE